MTDPCYAHHVFNPWREKPNGTRVVAAEAQWRLPLKWNKAAECSCGNGFRGTHSPYCQQADRPRVFCASLADVFEDWQGPVVGSDGSPLMKVGPPQREEGDFPGEVMYVKSVVQATMQDVRARLFALIDATPNLDWLLLTKRPENVLRFTYDAWCPKVPGHVSQNEGDGHHWKWPRNVWLGVSVENQTTADERIPHLLRLPAAVRFLSCEPLLGEVDLRQYLGDAHEQHQTFHSPVGINWVIVGGESGPDARPCRVEWVRSLVEQCKAAGVACFVKQLGSKPVDTPEGIIDHGSDIESVVKWRRAGIEVIPASQVLGVIKDRKGGDMDEWPADLRVRQFPTTTEVQS